MKFKPETLLKVALVAGGALLGTTGTIATQKTTEPQIIHITPQCPKCPVFECTREGIKVKK